MPADRRVNDTKKKAWQLVGYYGYMVTLRCNRMVAGETVRNNSGGRATVRNKGVGNLRNNNRETKKKATRRPLGGSVSAYSRERSEPMIFLIIS